MLEVVTVHLLYVAFIAVLSDAQQLLKSIEELLECCRLTAPSNVRRRRRVITNIWQIFGQTLVEPCDCVTLTSVISIH